MTIAEQNSYCGNLPTDRKRNGNSRFGTTSNAYMTARSGTRTHIPFRMRDFKSTTEWLCTAVFWRFIFRLDAYRIAKIERDFDSFEFFAERLSPLPTPPLGRHVARGEGVVPSLILGRRRDVSALAIRADTWARRGSPQGLHVRRGEPLDPQSRLGLRGRPVSPLRADPPRDPPFPIFAGHGREGSALVGIPGV